MSRTPIPLAARVELAHAVIQTLAMQTGADLLHLKGPTADAAWYPPHNGSDVDVLVRPAHLAAMERRIAEAGWHRRGDYEDGSAWTHASAWWHDDWGWLDLHRSWPGIHVDPELAFDALSHDHRLLPLAHRRCPAPRSEAEVLLLALHEGRSGPGRLATDRLRNRWEVADPGFTRAVETLAAYLHAEVGLAAGLGRLEDYRDHPDHDLWAYYASGNTSHLDKWRARFRSAHAHGTLLREIRRAMRPAMEATATGDRPGAARIQARRAWHLLHDLLRPRTSR